MIKDKERIIRYLKASIHGIFKILPLFEEDNVGIIKYVDSLLFTLYSLDKALDLSHTKDYVDVLATLESVKEEINKKEPSHAVVKRETFKCISIVQNIVAQLEEGE
jgi:hypothetical protein